MANGEIDTIRKIVLIIPKASDHQGHNLGDVSNVIRIVPPRRNLYGVKGGGLWEPGSKIFSPLTMDY